jgi:hypothetical protein
MFWFRRRMRAEIKRNPSSAGNTLLAGPWVGEFGWELLCWQGYLRARSAEFDRVVVLSRPEMAPLYADFCDEFIPYQPLGVGISGFMCAGHEDWPNISRTRDYREYVSGNFHIGYNRDRPALSSKTFLRQKFLKYGKTDPLLSFDVVLHIRLTDKNRSGIRNGWTLNGWAEFLKGLRQQGVQKIGCIGHPESAGALEGCADLRGLPMDKLFDVLASSRVLVGPSSGPMHLGALCGCPHVVWSGVEENRPKYEKYWNPFSTPVRYIHHSAWQPGVDVVLRHTLEMLEAGKAASR